MPRKVKHIFAFFFAAMVLLTTSGFALHTITCEMTGDTYQSVIEKKCCCEGFTEDECCNEESLVVNVDSQAASKEFNFDVNPVFFGAFFTQFIELAYPVLYKVDYLGYFKNPPPPPEHEIIILVQSFLL